MATDFLANLGRRSLRGPLCGNSIWRKARHPKACSENSHSMERLFSRGPHSVDHSEKVDRTKRTTLPAPLLACSSTHLHAQLPPGDLAVGRRSSRQGMYGSRHIQARRREMYGFRLMFPAVQPQPPPSPPPPPPPSPAVPERTTLVGPLAPLPDVPPPQR
jgi:hypothetical protein